MTKPKAPTLKQARKACLDIHSLIVRTRAGFVCEAIGVIPGECSGPLQCAHIIPKKRAVYINTEVSNGFCMCARHHILMDQNPAQWARMLARYLKLPEVLDLQLLQEKRKVDETRSDLKRYRAVLPVLVVRASSRKVDLTPIPKHILKWVEAQDAS